MRRCQPHSPLSVALILLCITNLCNAGEKTADGPETPHLQFFTEYIRELAANEDVRAAGEKELAEAGREDQFAVSIHVSTATQLELRSQVSMLKDMRLNPPYEDVIPNIINFYQDKIELHEQLIDISSAFIGGPRKDVDYGKLAAEVPKIRAKLEYLDHSIFKATPLFALILVNPKPNSKNQLDHLLITRAERRKLLNDLTLSFGSKLDKTYQNYIVSSASLLKTFLLKDYRCSDDPWD